MHKESILMINRTALFVGVSLAVAGTVMLVGLADTTAGDAISQVLRLWPLAIIALGVGLLVRRTRFAVIGTVLAASTAGLLLGGVVVAAPNVDAMCGDGGASSAAPRSGILVGRASATLELDCGDLTVAMADGTAWALQTRSGTAAPIVEATNDALVVRSVREDWYRSFHQEGDDWQVSLPRDIVLDLATELNAGRGSLDLSGAAIGALELDVNAGEARLDLTTATVESIDVEVNAGAATVLLPARADLVGELEVAAGAIEICVPPGLGVRVQGDAEFGDTTFNGLVRVGDAWETPGRSTATHHADLSVSAQAGSVVVNPAGGCK
jgi:hypothetical protein